MAVRAKFACLCLAIDIHCCATVMFKNMGRQAFGKVQAKLFPKYFLVSVLTLAVQIATLKFAMPIGLQREQLTSLGESLSF